ncbi:hypothetical protein QBC34DRAFT_290600 [Podospora aff. communis PSN243]|uniref:Ataxin-10 homolog n=1 Tax=Podospora aff. communis PSN243 TaxID=3040156 RepID=A0AAV9H108_9PEZI|nr:hypothetical protein QBC34DRAFT_290600 [Podospora aff. communis PSN243]
MASPDSLPALAQSSDDNPRSLTIEELCFSSGMSCFEGWLKLDPAIGPKTMAYVTKFITRTLEKTHNLKDVRETLSRSVEIWIWLTKCFAAAIPSLTTRSIGPLSTLNDPDRGVTPQESTALITKNYPSLKEDLQLLIKLMHIARNLLVVPEPEIPQDLCAAAQFDEMLVQTITLCVNVTSKAYDGDILDESARHKLTEISDLYKKLLVTCLQQAHNWIAKNDRNKMTFWYHMLLDDDAGDEDADDCAMGGFRPDVAKSDVLNWIVRNSRFCDKARKLILDYETDIASRGLPPGHLIRDTPLAWNWMPAGSVEVRADSKDDAKITPQWREDVQDKFERDRLYGRVSREVDMWWLKVRDPNYDEWVVPMPTVEFAQLRTDNCKATLVDRYAHTFRQEDLDESARLSEGAAEPDYSQLEEETAEDYLPEEDADDDESYGEGPMSGLLTEVPNILDPKQIEALHMIVKSCILDNAGLALTRAGENLQKTRCRMFLAMICGRSLLREILVFIAVWEKGEQSLIFQLTTQIVEAIHHSALIPYAWQSLRIPKDIISPAQTVLLKLINNMFRVRNADPPPIESKEHLRDIKLLHFLFIQFRSRIVPECVALMHLQAQIRNNCCDPSDFPVDTWDMERAKDGLQQFLELLTTVNELSETRAHLIEWEATYELLTLLKGLEAGVPKKPLVEPPSRSSQRPSPNSSTAAQADDEDLDRGYDSGDPPPPPPPPMQESAHKFPWAGIKGQILHILAGLLQPPPGRSSPGNPEVQSQIIHHNGIVSLLNCCVYDDHNRYARERVQICLKWLMDGSDAANNFLRELVAMSPPPNLRPPPAAEGQPSEPGPIQTVRIDGVAGEVKVRVKAGPAPPPQQTPAGPSSFTQAALPSMAASAAFLDDRNVEHNILPPIQSVVPSVGGSSASSQSTRARSDDLLRDILTLADEAARLAMGRKPDADETEEEDFM